MTKREQKKLNKKLFCALCDEIVLMTTMCELLEAGADIHARNENHETLLHVACKHLSPYWDKVRFLLEKGLGAEINAKDCNGNTPLLLACQDCDAIEDCLKLIDAGADIHTRNDQCETLLHIAAQKGNSEMLRILLKLGMQDELNALDKSQIGEAGNTPLYVAIWNRKYECARILIEAGANIYTRDSWGKPLLNTVAAIACGMIMKTMLERIKQKDLNMRDKQGNTPLYAALTVNNNECAWLLIEAGADIHAKNENSQTMLHGAAAASNAEIMKFLLSNGFKDKINEKDSKGKTPLHIACEEVKGYTCVRMLLDAGANPNMKTPNGLTPLHYAGWKTEHIRLLLKAGADVDATDDYGRTALIRAVEGVIEHHSNSYYDVMHLLLENGANIYAANKEGKTVLDFAENHPYLRSILQEWMNK